MHEVFGVKTGSVLSGLPDGLFLSQINLAGTHDSATAVCAFPRMAQCQTLSVSEQLDLGIRLLDIRLCRRGNIFYLVHGKANCYSDSEKKVRLTFDTVFDAVRRFLQAHPRETVVLSIKQDRGFISTAFFAAFYKAYIEPYRSLWVVENRVPTLQECRGRMVLMRRCICAASLLRQTACGLDFSVWEDQGAKAETEPCAVTLHDSCRALVQDRYRLPPEKKWAACAKPFLDSAVPAENLLLLHFLSTSGGRGIPAQNAPIVNAAFAEYALSETHAHGWFFMDFPTPALCEKLAASNYILYGGARE